MDKNIFLFKQINSKYHLLIQILFTGGGEEYLTFEGCSVNVGNAMDAKSGIFTAPYSAAYLFSLHVCTHDLKKALVAIRRNGIEVASIYDQVR